MHPSKTLFVNVLYHLVTPIYILQYTCSARRFPQASVTDSGLALFGSEKV